MKPFIISTFLLLRHRHSSTPKIIRPKSSTSTATSSPAPTSAQRPLPNPSKSNRNRHSQGKITAVGTDANLLKLKAPSTKIINLNGAFAMPGFNDAHTHIASAGQQKLTIDLDHDRSLAEMQQRIKTYASTAKSGTWLQGGGWDHTIWPTKTLPTRADIDAITAGHPAFFPAPTATSASSTPQPSPPPKSPPQPQTPQAPRSTATPTATHRHHPRRPALAII